ncbi:MAG: RDD family protein, partial [Pirellula sp.]
ADSEAVGTEVDCRHCGQQITVPEATPERIARALALLEQEPELSAPKAPQETRKSEFNRNLSDKELVELARRESFVPLNQMDFQGFPLASVSARLIASIVDGILLMMSWVLGFFLLVLTAKLGGMENPFGSVQRHQEFNPILLLVFGLSPTIFVLGQWYLLASSGQTIGKKLLMIRIVSETGRLPGFIQAVVLRNWVRVLFSFIPFFGLVDLLFIFSASRKCLHDYVASTRVVTMI